MIFVLAVIVALVALITWRAASKKVSDNPGFRSTANLSGAAAAFFTVVAILQLFTQVPVGHVGVVGFFGVVSARVLPAGINLVNPLAKVRSSRSETRRRISGSDDRSQESEI